MSTLGCASSTQPDGVGDGESHFLVACSDDCEGDLACVDLVCTSACTADSECQQLASDARCLGGTERHCDVECALDAECELLGAGFVCEADRCRATSTPQTDASTENCRGPGRYQAGKEGSYQPCCRGLTEVFWQVPAEQDGQPICSEPPGHREYGCVEGSCGDGTCEAGEDGPCGCMADCPGAIWGEQRADAGSDGGTNARPDGGADGGANASSDAGAMGRNPHTIDPDASVTRQGCYPAFDESRNCEAAFAGVNACDDASSATLLPSALQFSSGTGCYYFCPDVPDCGQLTLDDASDLLCRFAEANDIDPSLGLRALCGPEPTEHGPCCFGVDANQTFN